MTINSKKLLARYENLTLNGLGIYSMNTPKLFMPSFKEDDWMDESMILNYNFTVKVCFLTFYLRHFIALALAYVEFTLNILKNHSMVFCHI